jgi:hypothetical protein
MCWCGRTLPSWAADRRTVEAAEGVGRADDVRGDERQLVDAEQ